MLGVDCTATEQQRQRLVTELMATLGAAVGSDRSSAAQRESQDEVGASEKWTRIQVTEGKPTKDERTAWHATSLKNCLQILFFVIKRIRATSVTTPFTSR